MSSVLYQLNYQHVNVYRLSMENNNTQGMRHEFKNKIDDSFNHIYKLLFIKLYNVHAYLRQLVRFSLQNNPS